MAGLTITSSSLRAKFGPTPASVSSLDNLSTGIRLCRGGGQSFLVRMPRAVSEPVFLDRCAWLKSDGSGIRGLMRDASGAFEASLWIVPSPHGLSFTASVKAPDPLWTFEYRLEGLDLEEVVIPALGGQSLSSSMPGGTSLTYKYPFWLNAQFVLGMSRRGGIWLRSMDTGPVFKYIRIRRTGEKFDISYAVEASGPLRSRTLEATWYLDCFAGTWKEPAEIHRDWLERAFSLSPFGSDPTVPAWAGDIDFVLEIWGIGRESTVPYHTFDQMAARLRKWKNLHPPQRTLVYLPGFAEHGIDSHAPSYAPSPALGGAEKFKALLGAARDLGYRVMVHTNVLAMTFDNPLFGLFERHQVVDVFGRRQGWGMDIDGDWLAEPFFAYINPGAKEWGDLMEQVIGDLVRSFGVDGVFLDQTLLAFNVGSGPNFINGMRSHILRLRQAFPGTLFAGEGIHEHVVRGLPMAQIHGIDSIAETHGMEGRASWRKAHPVSGYVFGKFTRLTAHLLTRHPSHPMFSFQESAYAMLGVIPALCLYRYDQKLDGPQVRKMLARAERLRGSR